MHRRDFCHVSLRLAATGALSLPVLLDACATARYVAPIGSDDTRLTIDAGTLATDGAAVLVDAVHRVGAPIYVRRDSADRYVALALRCTHRGCQVDAGHDGFVCPCHGSEFTRDGAVVQGPATQPLSRFRVTRDGRRLHIHLAPTDPANA